MTPLTLAVIFASPAMFPDHSPLAVWIGMGCIAVALGLLWKADEMGRLRNDDTCHRGAGLAGTDEQREVWINV